MPSNRFDDDIPRIMIDQEDRETYRQSRNKGQHSQDYAAPTESKTTNTTQSDSRAVPASSSSSSGFPVMNTLLFLLVLMGFGGSYYLYMQQQQLTSTLVQAQSRIQDLENQLSATGEEMGESAIVIQSKVSALDAKTKELWSQMDKLWASAWRRNQSDIKTINQQLASIGTGTKDINAQIKTLQTDITASITNIDLLQEQLNTESGNVENVSQRLEQSSRSLEKVTQDLASVSRRLRATDKINNTLLERINALEKWQKQTKSSLAIPQEPVKKAIPPPLTVGD